MREIIKPVAQMEHISAQEFCDNMEAILDRVLIEDTGIVIDSQNKAYVLCPYRWIARYESEQIETALIYSLCYALGSDDESAIDVCQMISDAAGSLTEETTDTVICMLEKCIEQDTYQPYREAWENLLHLLVEQKAVTQRIQSDEMKESYSGEAKIEDGQTDNRTKD